MDIRRTRMFSYGPSLARKTHRGPGGASRRALSGRDEEPVKHDRQTGRRGSATPRTGRRVEMSDQHGQRQLRNLPADMLPPPVTGPASGASHDKSETEA